ncbi:MAG: hypothetical protein WBV94_14420 [Blastocatellia bacterium]
MSVQINTKDLPGYGLKLVAPTDPLFDGKFSTLLKDHPNPLAEGLRSYSVLLENTGKKTVVGYRLRWDLIKADGTVSMRQAGGVNMGAFMDEARPGLENPSLSSGFAIGPRAMAFVSLAGSLGDNDNGGITGYASGSKDRAVLDQLRQSAKDKQYPSLVDTIIAELQTCTSITVSLDGIFFEDGTFVGPDTTEFFVTVEASVNAKRDLMQEIAFAVEHKRSMDAIFNYINEVASSPFPVQKMNKGDLYNLFKKSYAEEMLRMKAAMSSQKAVEMALQQSRKAGLELRKL